MAKDAWTVDLILSRLSCLLVPVYLCITQDSTKKVFNLWTLLERLPTQGILTREVQSNLDISYFIYFVKLRIL